MARHTDASLVHIRVVAQKAIGLLFKTNVGILTAMNFSEALDCLKNGEQMRRATWLPGLHLVFTAPDGLWLHTAQGIIGCWVVSQTIVSGPRPLLADIFAEDWELVIP